MTTDHKRPADDPYNLARFVSAQEGAYKRAYREILAARKDSHWMWFVFPQLAGLGHSDMARRYAISGLPEATAYMEHPVLGPRLLECCEALLKIEGSSASEIFGFPDDMKLRSSMTLFAQVGRSRDACRSVLDQYFGGKGDDRTLSLLASLRA
ncbi:MAG: DUF1810 domain-containing protein [Steroidobacteraceae bacterium]